MSVEDKKLYESTSRKSSVEVDGVVIKTIRQSVSVAAADSDGSVYRVAKLPANACIKDIRIINDAITAGSDFDLGLYDGEGGAVADKDVLDDGLSMTTARTQTSPGQGLTAVGVDDRLKTLYELAGDSDVTYPGVYDVALTANTVGTAAGTIIVDIDYYIAA